jgi:hypothetical protein
MKNVLSLILIALTLAISSPMRAQEYKSFEIENIAPDAVWPAVYKTFQELKLPRPIINKKLGTGNTSFYNYETLLVKNRLRFEFEYKSGKLSVSVAERQYLTDKGWADNLLPFSKKQASKLLDPIQERITTLVSGQPYTAAAQAAELKNVPERGKAGLYDDFALVKTNDEKMELLGLHRNGNLVGFNLSEDKKRVESMVFRTDENAGAVILLFNEDGSPRSLLAGGYAINYTRLDAETARLTVFDTLGHFISSAETALEFPEIKQIGVESGAGQSGPFILNPVMVAPDLNDLTDYLGYAALAMKGVACVATLPTAVGAVVPCTAFALDVLTWVVPEDAFLYRELQLTDALFSLVTFSNPITTFDKVGTIVGGLKDAASHASEMLDRIFPPGELIVAGNPEVKVGDFGEMGEPVLFYALSNYPEVPVVWGTSSDAIKIIPVNPDEVYYRPGYSTVMVFALEPEESGEVTLTASQMNGGELIQASQKIHVKSPGYYYMPDCQQLFDLKVISAADLARCDEDAEACEDALDAAGDHILVNDPEILALIIREHLLAASEITDPDMRLKTEKLNFLRKIWKEDGSTYPPSEAGEFRDFVRQSPCMFKWFSYGDRQTIIALSHEGMSKIEAIEKKIEGLQKAANESNYQKIGADIMKLEESIPAIKETYEARIMKVAEKQTIRYETRKSDPEKYYTVQDAVVTGVRWGKYDGTPNLLLDIFFTPQKATKTQQFFDETRTFDLFLTQFSFSFVNGSDDPVQYALIIGDQIREKGSVQTAIRMKIFEDDIRYFDFYRSSAGAVRIE